MLDEDGQCKMELEVPPNTKALVILPSETESEMENDEQGGKVLQMSFEQGYLPVS